MPLPDGFRVFEQAARIGHAKFRFLVGVWDLVDKRQHVLLYQLDLPHLVTDYLGRRQVPHAGNPNARLVDALPGLRLASACEGLSHAVYAMYEIAARFANRASAAARAHPEVPSSFNDICKRMRAGKLDAALVGDIRNLEFYERVRELRTEWTHYSTIFIGEESGAPILVARSERNDGDRIHFADNRTLFKVEELIRWSEKAREVADNFCLECYRRYILPGLDLDQQFTEALRDESGFPIMEQDGSMRTTTMTVREYLRMLGLV